MDRHLQQRRAEPELVGREAGERGADRGAGGERAPRHQRLAVEAEQQRRQAAEPEAAQRRQRDDVADAEARHRFGEGRQQEADRPQPPRRWRRACSPSADAPRACWQRWKNMPAAMMAMTCQASQSPGRGLAQRRGRPAPRRRARAVTSTAETASVADRPGRPATRALARPEASRPSTSRSGRRASRVVTAPLYSGFGVGLRFG